VALLPADGSADPWFRPVWKDGDDASPPLPRRPPGRPDAQGPAPDGFAGVDFPALLGPIIAAQDSSMPGAEAVPCERGSARRRNAGQFRHAR
jgi:hypothetical protein